MDANQGMNTIAEQYAIWWAAVRPANPSELQTREMKRAFYSGAEAYARINFNIGHPAVTEAQGVQILTNLQKEMHQFGMAIAEGKA